MCIPNSTNYKMVIDFLYLKWWWNEIIYKIHHGVIFYSKLRSQTYDHWDNQMCFIVIFNVICEIFIVEHNIRILGVSNSPSWLIGLFWVVNMY
jgi:hypothetical protein